MRRTRKGWRLPPLLAMVLGLLLSLAPLLATAQPGAGGAELQVFVREGCPHCAHAKAFLPELRRQRPEIRVRLRPLESDPAAIDDLLRYSRQAGIGAPGVPTFVLEGQVLVGFDGAEGRGKELLALIDRRQRVSGSVSLGRFGSISASTAGLPAVYTAVLSQQNLGLAAHYGYLGLYIVGYIADDALMVGIAVLALSSNRLTEGTGRWLKLISGVVMVALGLLLLLRPGWLF